MSKPLIGRNVLLKRVLKTERVDVPEWDGEIILRALSSTDTIAFTKFGESQDVANDIVNASMRLAVWVLAHSWVDEAGELVLTMDDMGALMDGNGVDLINRLGKRAMILSGLAPDAIVSAEKNSGSSQSGDSGTP